MFSPNIQNLVNQSGKDMALQRSVELKKHVETLYGAQKSQNPFELPEKNTVTSFAQVLKGSVATEAYKTLDSPFGMSVKPQAAIQATNNSVVNPLTSSKSQVLNIISNISKKYGVDEDLVKSLIKQESGFRVDAVSKSGAMGLMQLMPQTAKGLGLSDPMNPIQNIDGGVRYLKQMLTKYNGNLILALSAYNAGPNAVDKYNDIPPYAETQNYVKSILTTYLGTPST